MAKARVKTGVKNTKMVSLGVFVFIIGLLSYLGFEWSVVLMIVGVLIALKGLMSKK